MNNSKFKFLLLLIIALPTLACGAVGVYDPQATQVAMEGTVTALQATIAALESNINQAQPDTGKIIVVTATATPVPSATVTSGPTGASPASLGQTINLTSTPVPSPTATPITITSQDTVITVVATFTPTPTPKQYNDAPILIEPREGAIVEEGREILLHWSWNGILGPDERYDIKIRPDGSTRSAYVAWEEGSGHDLVANLAPGRYYWTVQVIRGHYKDNIREPENRVLDAFLSPESEPRLIIVAKKSDNKKPTPTPTPTSNLNSNNQAGTDDTPANSESGESSGESSESSNEDSAGSE